ncbi:putative FMN-dependent luciferase-like monooxygenase [Pseudonocardia aurantiaca]|uniref:FMN-dependent luciferase-like monooxygenase n=1 Tax=Pseudonocardia aurantiaca TaxID=75290 RepID=A0ABW4FYT7_9PSEU
MTKRLGLFTRLLDPGYPPAEVYHHTLEQFAVAERLGFDIGWVAQHHFDPEEGGLPSPLVFLASVAARTERIRLGTGIITVALEDPVRVAEDAAVLDTLSGGRLELGLGSGGSTDAFTVFGRDPAARADLYSDAVARLLDALAGRQLGENGARLHPDGTRLLDDIWHATFSRHGGTRAGTAGAALLLSRTQPRTEDAPHATLAQIQQPIVAAHAAALPPGVRPRVGASRSVLVGRDGDRVRSLARAGLVRFTDYLRRVGQPVPAGDADALLAAFDVHVGTPEQVIASLSADPVVVGATDLIFQVHPADPGQDATLESIELVAEEVAPALGWVPAAAGAHS